MKATIAAVVLALLAAGCATRVTVQPGKDCGFPACTISMREPELCSPMMFRAKFAPCSAAVQAPRDCRIGITSLSMVLGRPTTVRV